jgi:hypothetical protein
VDRIIPTGFAVSAGVDHHHAIIAGKAGIDAGEDHRHIGQLVPDGQLDH